MPTTGGSGSDTLDITIQQSDQRDFTDAERIKEVRLRKQDASGTIVAGGTLDQVVGGTSSPDATLQQGLDIAENNVNKFLRASYTIAGTATSFTDITLLLLANKKV